MSVDLKRYRRWLIALFVLSILGLLIYEAAGILDPAPGDTISELVWALMDRSHMFTASCGVLFGHFAWQRKRPPCALFRADCPYRAG